MRIALTDYSTLEELLRAVRDLPYEGGSRRTGDALRFLVDPVFSPVITRDHAPKVRRLLEGRVDTAICLSVSYCASYRAENAALCPPQAVLHIYIE